jgi:hypothetical protein
MFALPQRLAAGRGPAPPRPAPPRPGAAAAARAHGAAPPRRRRGRPAPASAAGGGSPPPDAAAAAAEAAAARAKLERSLAAAVAAEDYAEAARLKALLDAALQRDPLVGLQRQLQAAVDEERYQVGTAGARAAGAGASAGAGARSRAEAGERGRSRAQPRPEAAPPHLLAASRTRRACGTSCVSCRSSCSRRNPTSRACPPPAMRSPMASACACRGAPPRRRLSRSGACGSPHPAGEPLQGRRALGLQPLRPQRSRTTTALPAPPPAPPPPACLCRSSRCPPTGSTSSPTR